MPTRIQLGDITIDVTRKDIKNLHLSVHPPEGKVRISAPQRMKLDTIRVFAISKLAWIKRQQKKLRGQDRETPREYLDRESHYVWGKRYLLKIVEEAVAPKIELKHSRIILHIRPGTKEEIKKDIFSKWYREQIRLAVPDLVAKWEPIAGVEVHRIFVRKMKTKWGSCNPARGSIRLNTELAKKPPECLEYIVLHEMVHLIEQTHNTRFVLRMDKFMPQWRIRRDRLNHLPVRHEEWMY